jgi:hypothetical protein
MPFDLYAQDAEAALGVMKGDTFDETGNLLGG